MLIKIKYELCAKFSIYIKCVSRVSKFIVMIWNHFIVNPNVVDRAYFLTLTMKILAIKYDWIKIKKLITK